MKPATRQAASSRPTPRIPRASARSWRYRRSRPARKEVFRKRTLGGAELFGVATKALAGRSIAGENEVGAVVSFAQQREGNDRKTDYFN